MPSATEPPSSTPRLLISSFPGDGHTGPLLRIAAGLIQRGWDVSYLGVAMYEAKIRALGAEFFEALDFFTPAKFAVMAKFHEIPLGPKRYGHSLSYVFWADLPQRAARLQETLEILREREPGREIVVIEDGPNMSSIPWKHGKALPRGFDAFPKTLGISPCPLIVQSVDSAPSPLGLPPDSSATGKLRNQALNDLVNDGPFRVMFEKREEVFKECGCTSIPEHMPCDSWFVDFDQLLLLCSPSLEYKLSDMPSHIGFAGCLPLQPVSADLQYPSWWSEVTDKAASDRKIVFVTQGTVNFHPDDLIIPTIRALADRTDILTIAVLGSRGASLPPDIAVPSNARVLDYFPYDAVLAHTDVFVSNAGYGGFTHAVINGVPAVFAGQTEEKAEVAERAAVAGFAVNLRTQRPTEYQIQQGVDEVLTNGRYAKRAAELRAENEAMDSLGLIEEHILRLTN
jgi:UDP:flavonoid glycosyltransferase YjiC (YdhE family)